MSKHLALVFRHGDRSPTFNAFEPLAAEATTEAAAWAAALPTRVLSDTLKERFPIASEHERTRDEALGRTFGSLTGVGTLQIRRLGQVVAQMAGEHDLVVARCLSSNFRRTQFSAQCLLAGMEGEKPNLAKAKNSIKVTKEGQDILNVWGTDPTLRRLMKSNGTLGVDISKTSPEEEKARDVLTKAVPAFGYMVRPFSWLSALDHTMCREGKQGGGGPLRGRPASHRANEIYADMLQGREQLDSDSLKEAIQKVLHSPFATKKDVEQFLALIDRNNDGKIDASEMAHYLSRVRLPLPAGGVALAEFEQHARTVEKAVCRRFDAILTQPSVRRLSAGLMAKTVLSGIEEAVHERRKTPSANTTIDIYSAHDVTLVPLLKHFGIWNGMEDPWPGVAACMLFEVEMEDNGAHPIVRVHRFRGVRGELSGLEPRVLQLEPVAFRLGVDSPVPEASVDLERLTYFVKAM